MSKPQLIEFMIRKGNERKRDQCEAAQTLTRDSQSVVGNIVACLQGRVQAKRSKLAQLEEQRKNLEVEMTGLERAQQSLQGKINKREDQMRQSEMLVKKQKEELRQIQKQITPQLVADLYKFLEQKNVPKITQMIEALVGLLRNTEEVHSSDVKCYLAKHEGLIYKMQNVVYAEIR